MPRPRRGERRIDAAIDHLAQYGFPKLQIRKIINGLLQQRNHIDFVPRERGILLTSSVHNASMIQLYGRDGWVFLEEGSYRIVLEKLLEEQAQLEVNSSILISICVLLACILHHSCAYSPKPKHVKFLSGLAFYAEQEAAAADEASPENDMEVSPPVLSEALTESQPALEPQASHNSSPPREHALPPPPATGAAHARLPCYGWISEESETESELEDGEMFSYVPRPSISPKKDIPNPVETLPSKRKRPTRWDVRPNW
ncbi:hypothetical protein BAE44_0016150 [Dichanthelium oligosanthes]|uniref:WIYLD domain-containing protein n=1 Tax=Dichanthelium oligosanthes TaxID=888268 RepID=A0A1E5VCJ8_9POAL|nr:hypothetical protein BAE44_0016150 [Dichanthelium oligosanthes]